MPDLKPVALKDRMALTEPCLMLVFSKARASSTLKLDKPRASLCIAVSPILLVPCKMNGFAGVDFRHHLAFTVAHRDVVALSSVRL